MSPPPPSVFPAVDSVLSHYYRAIGGLDRLLDVDSRQMWETYTEGTLVAGTDIVWKRPDTRRVNVHAAGFEYSQGHDGRTWEYNFQSRTLVVDTGAAADAGGRGAEFDESFVAYAGKGGCSCPIDSSNGRAGPGGYSIRCNGTAFEQTSRRGRSNSGGRTRHNRKPPLPPRCCESTVPAVSLSDDRFRTPR